MIDKKIEFNELPWDNASMNHRWCKKKYFYKNTKWFAVHGIDRGLRIKNAVNFAWLSWCLNRILFIVYRRQLTILSHPDWKVARKVSRITKQNLLENPDLIVDYKNIIQESGRYVSNPSYGTWEPYHRSSKYRDAWGML